MLSASRLAGATDKVLKGHSALGSQPKRHHRAFSSKAWAQLGSKQAATVSLKSRVHEFVFLGARHSHAGPLGVFFPSSARQQRALPFQMRLRSTRGQGASSELTAHRGCFVDHRIKLRVGAFSSKAWAQLGSKQAATVSLKSRVHELVFFWVLGTATLGLLASSFFPAHGNNVRSLSRCDSGSWSCRVPDSGSPTPNAHPARPGEPMSSGVVFFVCLCM